MSIKSKKAKQHIDELSSRHGLSVYQATQAVLLAEQEAEERAMKAYCKSNCDGDNSCPKKETCYMLRMFVDNLNNGGQIDE